MPATRKKTYNPDKNYYWEDYTFLVVEDEIVNYKFIELTLKRTNAKVLHAKNGLEAIDFIKSNPSIDIILMDIELPLLNGYDATQQIRELNEQILIIAQTAYAMKVQRDKCFEVGCNDYIAKPYSSRDLLDVICKYIA